MRSPCRMRGYGLSMDRNPSPSAMLRIASTPSHKGRGEGGQLLLCDVMGHNRSVNPIESRVPHMSLQVYLAFVAACIALALLPGPVVTLVIANGLRHGTRAALTNIAGVQVGLAIVIGIVAIRLTSLMATRGYCFDGVRFAGAAYLVWLGIKLIRFPVEGVKADEPPPPPRGGFFLHASLVLLSIPKVMV